MSDFGSGLFICHLTGVLFVLVGQCMSKRWQTELTCSDHPGLFFGVLFIALTWPALLPVAFRDWWEYKP